MSIVPLAAILAGARPDAHTIAFHQGQSITLARWRADIAHNAERFRARHIQRGALLCDNSYWFLVGLLALLHIGATVIMPPNEQPGTLLALQSEFDLLVTDSHAARAPHEVIESSANEAPPAHFDFARSGIGFFTSGSTGEIKQVPKTLAHFEREAAALETLWGAGLRGVRIFGTVTHQHVFGMTFRLMWPILAGRPFESEFQATWEPLLARLTPRAMIVSSPAQLTRLGGLAPLAPEDRPSMVLTAGAPLPESAAAEAATIFGCRPTEIFGSTEAGVIGWRDGITLPPSWRPFPGVEVKTGTGGAAFTAIAARLRSRLE